ncbi:MAG: aminoglycoside phosphotransferase family protein [Actinomycetia bacterium]|nr:aminoglycoside phosphotransferase family protein [Actinomycetes bacterium]
MSDSDRLPQKAAQLVIEEGLVSAEEIIRYGLRVRNLSQSNSVALVEVGNGKGFAVKDMRSRRDAQQGTAECERQLYHSAAVCVALQPLLPKYFALGEDSELMILEGLVSYRRLDQMSDGRRLFDPEMGRSLGEALRLWHSNSTSLKGIGDAQPWLLAIRGSDRLGVLDSEDALREITASINEDSLLYTSIDRVQGSWSTDVVIHGDMRFANILVSSSPFGLRFIDWETSGWGDGRWDVAGIVQEFLSVGLSEGYGLADSSRARSISLLLDGYRGDGIQETTWEEFAPFVACRVMMRAIQLANWPSTSDAVVAEHLDLARELGAVSEDPFASYATATD